MSLGGEEHPAPPSWGHPVMQFTSGIIFCGSSQQHYNLPRELLEENTHNVGARGAEGVGPTDIEVGLVQGHQDSDEVEALSLRGKEQRLGAEHCSGFLGPPEPPPQGHLTSWLFFLKAHSEVFSAVGAHINCKGNEDVPGLSSPAPWGN